MQNQLKNQTSPYLLQHAENPVNWYPWCAEAFQKAQTENKPIFLSIGYSTCHWCHVMAHESFENAQVAAILNREFISIKVDKEERPDIDTVYMAACMAFTGNGGWPMSVFMTPEQQPFFVGSYFPPEEKYGMPSFGQVLTTIADKWKNHRPELLETAQEVVQHLRKAGEETTHARGNLPKLAMTLFAKSFDKQHGGFGRAPKFPAPHNLLFLLEYYRVYGDSAALDMAEKTLIQLYKGGIFDHIGYGFSRYSTDKYFLVPHFEKMLYDNALLVMAYAKAYDTTKNSLYEKIAHKTIDYVLREMTQPGGGFYSAQDADSQGEEGKYYVFSYDEVLKVLGDKVGVSFCIHYNITPAGNFEGKNIPNLLQGQGTDAPFLEECKQLYAYRKQRNSLHLDDKILLGQNCLMIGALCQAYAAFGQEQYLQEAQKAMEFLRSHLQQDGVLYVSYREKLGETKGFLEDYALYVFALLNLYSATGQNSYLQEAQEYLKKTMTLFHDQKYGGFYLYGSHNESLIWQPKEVHDGAVPSGNSIMAYNLVLMWQYTGEEELGVLAKEQLDFLARHAGEYPIGNSFFLYSLLLYEHNEEFGNLEVER